MSFFVQLETDMFIDLVFKAIENDAEDKLWEKWLAELPNMDKKSFVPFEEYKNKHFKYQETGSSVRDEEVLEDAESILKMMNESK